MSSRESASIVRPRTRRSIAHVPPSKMMPGADKANVTADLSTIRTGGGNGRSISKEKKSRSKSLGPGGLDALQDTSGNRRKSAVAIPLKSILKPTVPVSPVRSIPSFQETRKRGSTRSPSPTKNKGREAEAKSQPEEELLIDFSTPSRTPVTGTERLENPFDEFNAESAIRDAQEREEKERKERERKAILEQREARRKSMANRRVSFAPEATLHTWNVVELAEDSTSSSASNSTRRASSLTNSTSQATPEGNLPTSSPNPDSDLDAAFSPIQPQELKDTSNRQVSGPSEMTYDNAEQPEDLGSSPFSGSSVAGSEETGLQSPEKASLDEDVSDSENDFDGESTAMTLDEATAQTNASAHTDESTSSSARLNEALRQAAQEAGTKGIPFDETGDMSMEIADQEITGAFQPWIKKGQRISYDLEDLSALQDQENLNPFAQPLATTDVDDQEVVDDENEELSMDITNAVGRILLKNNVPQSVERRKSTGEETNYEEQTMEFTNVIGGIAEQPSPSKSDAESAVTENEEMTMEFETVFGGIVTNGNSNPSEPETLATDSLTPKASTGPNFSEWITEDDEAEGMEMEFTGAVGGILPPILEQTEPQDDFTAGMDLTLAMGKILAPGLGTNDLQQRKQLMELEVDSGQLISSPFVEQVVHSPPRSAPVASESGSPSIATVRSRRPRNSPERLISTIPSIEPSFGTPLRKPTTPSKQLTPQPPRPTTPGKTPPSSNITFRSASPKKLFRKEIRAAAKQAKSPGGGNLFEQDAETGMSTPAFILRPRERRSSGLGIDKEGLGSPKVAAILDRRRSIGEDAKEFVPHEQPARTIRFEDPLRLQEEVEREREEEENREDGHVSGLGDRESTLTLKDLISSLTPKKNKVGNRKSLHVGAAKGLLGKRPIELDEAEDDDDNTPKRLRGRQASPVKNVKLPAPPSKDETVGRRTRSSTYKGQGDSSPPKPGSTTPRQSRETIESTTPSGDPAEPETLPMETVMNDEQELNAEDLDWTPIQLQDFLNLTNIHFMELTTTKRRHTTAPNSAQKRKAIEDGDEKKKISLEDCVAAGVCTVPMLELYQHSCRELKSYISEGRQIIRSIETETFADNPPLFREYVTARPDIRLLMDNQFRNVKTHARLLSKAMWYEWRMKLLDGLKEGLDRHVTEMKEDEIILSQQEGILGSAVPELAEKHSTMQSEVATLQQMVDEMENCDQDELRSARERLAKVDADIAAKKSQLEAMQAELQEKIDTIEAGAELKAEAMAQIQEAERVKEECRGWSVKEVFELKSSVESLESKTGWSIVSAGPSPQSPQGPLLTMTYRDELQIIFAPNALKRSGSSERGEPAQAIIELSYRPKGESARQLSPAKSFILTKLRRNMTSKAPRPTSLKEFLFSISKGWDLAYSLEEEIRLLEFNGITKVTLTESENDALLRARCIVIGTNIIHALSVSSPRRKSKSSAAQSISQTEPQVQEQEQPARLDVDFTLTTQDFASAFPADLNAEVSIGVNKVYGFTSHDEEQDPNDRSKNRETRLSEAQMQELIRKAIKTAAPISGTEDKATTSNDLGQGVWSRAVGALVGQVF